MTGIRIEVDWAALVHQQWWHLPWHRRWLWLVPGARKSIEELAIRRLRGEDGDGEVR